MGKKSKKSLPHNWRLLVQQELKYQGVTIETQKLTDLKLGRVTDEELTKKILPILKTIKARHQKKLKLSQQLKAAC
ncbi:hypothetical protein [Limnovirga soli]|uniref:Uncharacterized protein n=1 Tax=Limnovirga soli TaxID=2656915 RepID=A0A8J8FFH4_9BACT|nr:hypothetical protein [Limnovirga soli]NNV55883.1 hypothetical protein [Limnovirga soli]